METQLRTRYLVIKLILDQGQFPGAQAGTDGSTKIIRGSSDYSDLSIDASISMPPGISNFSAAVTIYGLRHDDIFAFTKINFNTNADLFKNKIEIYAGYTVDNNGMPPFIYSGQVRMASPDFNNPNRPFTIISMNGIIYQNQIASNTNIQGQFELDTLFRSICQLQGGLIYEPNNVTGQGKNAAYKGSAMEQLRKATADYGYQVKFDGSYALVAPIGQQYREQVYQVDATNGMLGYPYPADLGINVRTRFNPILKYGQVINISSSLDYKYFNDSYYINGIESILQTHGAKWESVLSLNIAPVFNEGAFR